MSHISGSPSSKPIFAPAIMLLVTVIVFAIVVFLLIAKDLNALAWARLSIGMRSAHPSPQAERTRFYEMPLLAALQTSLKKPPRDSIKEGMLSRFEIPFASSDRRLFLLFDSTIKQTISRSSPDSDAPPLAAGIGRHQIPVNPHDLASLAMQSINDESSEMASMIFLGKALNADSPRNVSEAEQKALLLLMAGLAFIILLGLGSGLTHAKRRRQQLLQLTQAAAKFGQGDLDTPFPTQKNPAEIAALAEALEAARAHTRQMLAETTYAKSWLETLVQSIQEGIVTIDGQNRITSFNRSAERIMGYLSEEVIGKSINEVFLLPDDHKRFSDRMPAHGARRQFEVSTHGEGIITLTVTHAKLSSNAEESKESALVLRDITEEEAASNLRTYFLANISHEFRTPLSAINASVELLLEELEGLSKAEIQELLNSTHMSVSGLQTLIDNLLESISIEAGRFQIRRRLVDLNGVIESAIRMMKPLLNRRQQNLRVEKADKIPKVHVDPTRLTQVLVNLISNASKYSPVDETIELSIRQHKDHYLRIAVADRGPGIPNAERADVFRRFVRLDVHEGAQFGIGLGLSVVKAIVEEHGGTVGVDDRPGGGTIFWFTLPLDGGGR